MRGSLAILVVAVFALACTPSPERRPVKPATRSPFRLMEQGLYGQAASVLQEQYDRRPEDRLTRLLLARALHEDGRGTAAWPLVQGLLSDPDAEVLRLAAEIRAREFGKHAEALGYLERAMRLDPTPETRVQLHASQVALHRYDEALPGLLALERERPDSVEVLSLLAMARVETGRPDLAQPLLERAVALRPDDPWLQINLAEAYMDDKRFDPSRAILERVAERHPENRDAWLDLGEICYWLGDYDEAERLIRKASELDPGYFSPLNELGHLRALQGRHAKALEFHRQALELRPDYVDAHRSAGRALLELGRREEAAGHFRRALELKPTYQGETWALLARCLPTRQEREQALRQGIRTDPHDVTCYDALLEILSGPERRRIAAQKESLCREGLRSRKTGQ